MSLDRTTLAALRFGTGLRPGQPSPDDPAALLAGLRAAAAAPPLVGPDEDARLLEAVRGLRDARAGAAEAARAAAAERRGAPAADTAMEAEAMLAEETRALRRELESLQMGALARAATSPHGFGERMARFWSNHFAVSVMFPAHWSRVAAYEDQAIRPHMAGRFADLLAAAVRHPAMTIYLDQAASVGPNSPVGLRTGRGMNENLAREILELHTLGVGAPYGQDDVQALARLLTGTAVAQGRYVWRRQRAEPGRVRLLGKAYAGASEDEMVRALHDLAAHPATAAHLSRKLAVHFVADDPPAALTAALTETWAATDGDLRAVCRTLLEHPAAWGPPGPKLRQPWELVVAALRAAAAQGDEIAAGARFPRAVTLGALAEMGQQPGRAPGPDGWPEAAEAWITPAGLSARLRWGARLGRVLAPDLDPRDFARAALGPALGEKAAFAVAAASERWEAYAVFLASPDFNRR